MKERFDINDIRHRLTFLRNHEGGARVVYRLWLFIEKTMKPI